MRLRRAAFDAQKTLETFDFAANPKLSQKEIADLATCRFIERHENVFFVGPARPNDIVHHLAKYPTSLKMAERWDRDVARGRARARAFVHVRGASTHAR